MKTIGIVSLLIFLVIPLKNMAQWEWQNPLPHGNYLSDVYVFNEQLCWAVGSTGMIIFTHDGGITWTVQESGSWETLKKIQFINQYKGWIVGHGGTILITENSGTTWQDYSISSGNDINGLHFIDDERGWIVGEMGKVMYTQDGGISWDDLNSGCNDYFQEVFFTDELNGWIVGGHAIYNTTDGGAIWNQQYYNEYENPYDISFVDPDNGWIANANTNNGFVYHTSDGGQNWNPQEYLNATIIGVSFADQNIGWAVGSRIDGSGYSAYIFNTTDGGINWSEQWMDWPGKTLNGVHAANSQLAWAVGGPGLMLKTLNGSSWHEISSAYDPNTRYYSVFMIDDAKGWLVGGGESYFYDDWERIRYTSDGGLTWEVQQSANGQTTRILNDVFFINDVKGWAVGRSGAIRYTADGGVTDWEIQSGNSNMNYNDVFFIDPLNGWIAGNGGVIEHTEDGGNTWSSQTSTVNNNLNSTFFINDTCGWFVGDDGIILYTENGGITYEIQPSGVTNNFRSITFINDNKGWIAGEDILMLTTDSGNSWAVDTSITFKDLYEISFSDSLSGWICGIKEMGNRDQGIIYYTNDGGMTWNEQNPHCSKALYCIHFVNPYMGWTVGSSGTILHTENGGILNTIELHEQIYQGINFNAYPIPSSSQLTVELSETPYRNTSLSLFNINGQELLKQQLPSRKSEINISLLPAGIYIIKIQNEREVMVQKVIKQ